jgi:hypothetical protein
VTEKENKVLPKITSEMREKLKAQFPVRAYKSIDTKAYLGSLKPQYIVERLNDVFGIGRWEIIHEVVERMVDYVLIKGTIKIYDYDVYIPWHYGGHKLEGKNLEPADGYKSAVTDCFSKCASFLEIGNDLFKGCLEFGDGFVKLTPDENIVTAGENKASHLKKKDGGGNWGSKDTNWSSKNNQTTGQNNNQSKGGLPSWLISKVGAMNTEEIVKYDKNLTTSEKYAALTKSEDYKDFIKKELERSKRDGN